MEHKPVIGGSYPARRTSAIAIKASESGALMAYIPYALVGDAIHEGTHSMCIGTKDGTIQEKTILNLREIFPAWTTANPFDLQRIPEPGEEAEFKLSEYFDDSYTNKSGGVTQKFSFKWLNKLSSGTAPATQDEEAEILAKWGAKFSAVLGGKASAPIAQAVAPELATAASKPGRKPKAAAVVQDVPESSAEAVYAAICEKHASISDDEKGELYFKLQDKAFPTKERDGNGNFKVELTPKEWGMVLAKV